MLIIKPYGRSQTQHASDSQRNRLHLPSGQAHAEAVEQLQNNLDFVMAQWISVIDKIIRKQPQRSGKGDKKIAAPQVSTTQFNARKALGMAALQCIEKEFSELSDLQKKQWGWKVHPYDCTNLVEPQPKDRITGRWYSRFVGAIHPQDITQQTVPAIVQKIHDHLYQQALRPNASTAVHTQGHTTHQLHTIARNVHALKTPKASTHVSSDSAWQSYFLSNDVVACIYKELQDKHDQKDKTKHQSQPKPLIPTTTPKAPLFSDRATIAQHLFNHYAKVFATPSGTPTPVKDLLNEAHPLHAQWLVHQCIKATYKALFDNASIKGLKHIQHKLPANSEAMRQLIENRRKNHDIGHLVRLGKVLHYEAAERGQLPRACWGEISTPAVAEGSAYWLSEGQAEIKRSEALVRSFKQAITHAGHTLSQLSDWSGNGDIFLNASEAAKQADAKTVEQRVALLFGRACSDLFPSCYAPSGNLQAAIQALLAQSIEAWAQLRHASFHFKGKHVFLEKLQNSLAKNNVSTPELDAVAQKLWEQDGEQRQKRIRASLEAAHCLDHLSQAQLNAVYLCIAGDKQTRIGSSLDMPRLNRVLNRAQNTKLGMKPLTDGAPTLQLSTPAKRQTLENSPAQRCRYVLLKLLYEQDFAAWLQDTRQETIDKWIGGAIARNTKAARELNGKGLQPQTTIHAKAERLWHEQAQAPTAKSTSQANPIARFFHDLAAATASEFRVQRHYASDGEQAQAQAAYIDDLKCDVVARAFLTYLKNKWPWLLQDLAVQNTPSCMDALPADAHEALQLDNLWQQRLYFLLHMVPVGVVSQLLHQLRKWQVLSTQAEASKTAVEDQALYTHCLQVMVLYLDMHDAKFDGGTAIHLDDTHRQPLKDCFKRVEDFAACLPASANPSQPGDAHIPLRGLREMLRFGGAKVLAPVFRQHPISAAEYADWQKLQAVIKEAQKTREDLHAEWVKNRKGFTGQQAYAQALETCMSHRHLAHRVRLVDHLQLHSLLMAVLARLADYAGLWERDLYFVSLALCYHEGLDPAQVFNESGNHGNYFDGGQIVEALRNESSPSKSIQTQVAMLFGTDCKKGDPMVNIRNALSHFNMLRHTKHQTAPAPIDLTHWVNQTRRLLAHDRKLKNAVSKSIMELLEREGLVLTWQTNHQHQLELSKVDSKKIAHLGAKQGTEPHHSGAYCAMVRQIF